METVTVVMPTHNRASVARVALQTILDQRGVDVRVVVVDEASTDETPAMLDALDDPRVQVIRHAEPRGLPRARNAGVRAATTRWVAFCDDDDVWAPDKLARQLAELRAVPGARWACSGNVSVDTSLHVVGFHRPPASGEVFEDLRVLNVIPGGGSSVVVDKELFEQLGGFDPEMRRAEDYDMWCRLAQASPVACVDLPLVGYRIWPGSLTTDPEAMRIGHDRVIARFRGDLAPELVRAGELQKEMYLGRFYIRRHDRVGALRHYVRIAVRWRVPKQALHGLAAFIAPRLAGRRRDAHERAQVPAWWADAAEAWLDPLRRSLSSPATGTPSTPSSLATS